MSKTPEIRPMMGRLAYREEGAMWNCYYARPDTMEDAIWLGSLAMRMAVVPAVKRRFMDLMRDASQQLIEEVTGAKITLWHERPAPEHERAPRRKQ